MQIGISRSANMDDAITPPASEAIHRKSVSFCLPSDHDDRDEKVDAVKVPGRLLIHQVPRTVKSAPPLSLQSRRGVSSAQSHPPPCPPLENDALLCGGRFVQRPPLKRSLSVPTGLTLANVLTKQRSESLLSNNVQARRYSSSSMVKQRMMQRSEKEFNRVAAKVSDFCRRVDNHVPSNQTLLKTGAIDDRLRSQHPVDQNPSEMTIMHRGRRYRTSLSLSSNSADNHSDRAPGGIKPVAADVRTRDINSNEQPQVKQYREPDPAVEVDPEGDNGHRLGIDNECDDGDQSELNERISKWLNDVNNSVVRMGIKDKDDDSSQITVIPLRNSDVGLR